MHGDVCKHSDGRNAPRGPLVSFRDRAMQLRLQVFYKKLKGAIVRDRSDVISAQWPKTREQRLKLGQRDCDVESLQKAQLLCKMTIEKVLEKLSRISTRRRQAYGEGFGVGDASADTCAYALSDSVRNFSRSGHLLSPLLALSLTASEEHLALGTAMIHLSAMTLVVLVLALVNRAGVGNTAIVAPRIQKNFVSRVSDIVATALSPPREDEEYTGRLFGVTCDCVLHRQGQYASLHLRGIPVGGWLSGTAWFQTDGASVVLDPALERAVARRMTSILSARYQKIDDTVHVLVSIPIFGVSKIILQRKQRAGENAKV